MKKLLFILLIIVFGCAPVHYVYIIKCDCNEYFENEIELTDDWQLYDPKTEELIIGDSTIMIIPKIKFTPNNFMFEVWRSNKERTIF